MDSDSRSRWWLLESGRCPAPENMAWDEALLEAGPRLQAPVLRFYGWSDPAASFGYFQAYADVARLTALRPLIRRPTGGGIVPHDADWTYSLVFPPGHDWYRLRAVESYQRVHAWLCDALRGCGVAAELAPSARRSAVAQCFVGAEQFDVVARDRKLAGAAQRRARAGLLIQGSIQPPAGLPRPEFEKAFLAEGTRRFGADWVRLEPDALLRQRAQALAMTKYAGAEHNQKR